MTATARRVWNFVLTGDVRSGAHVLLSALNRRPGVICHAGLFGPDDDARRAAHEAYYGPVADPVRLPEWFKEGAVNPCHYINHTVFDNPRHAETAIGLHLSYRAIRRYELYDLFETRGEEGDFSVVHVVRNPVACYVSLKQAEATGEWAVAAGQSGRKYPPLPVRLDPADLTAFCRDAMATAAKVRAACRDRLEVTYRDLVVDFQRVMRRVFDHVELPDTPTLASAGCRRLKNRDVRDRVTNLAEVKAAVPSDVRQMIDSDDLF